MIEYLKLVGSTSDKAFIVARALQEIFNECPTISEDDIVKLWNNTYVVDEVRLKSMRYKRVHAILNDSIKLEEMFWNAYYNRDNSRIDSEIINSKDSYIDDFGIIWYLKHEKGIVGKLFAFYDGTIIDMQYKVE